MTYVPKTKIVSGRIKETSITMGKRRQPDRCPMAIELKAKGFAWVSVGYTLIQAKTVDGHYYQAIVPLTLQSWEQDFDGRHGEKVVTPIHYRLVFVHQVMDGEPCSA